MWKIIEGDVRAVVKNIEAESFDAMLCDPPYGFSFMGKRWDYQVPSATVWSTLERALKPGAHAMIFGGPRTFHRLATAVEDGGFEIRDLLQWLFSQGFPKSLDVSKALDKLAGARREVIGTRDTFVGNGGTGNNFLTENSRQRMVDVTAPATALAKAWAGFGTSLKPACEPIVLAMKMTETSIAENARRFGVGGIDIDGSRIEKRFPANVILDKDAAAMLDEQSGERPGGRPVKGNHGRTSMYAPDHVQPFEGYNDSGGASRFFKVIDWEPADLESAEIKLRFFYTPKADTYQRNSGLEGREAKSHMRVNAPRASEGDKHKPTGANSHPTVKPIALIRYLAKMILPPPRETPRRILVPFSGSGSEMIGCLQAGWDEVVGIEREAEYVAIAKERITKGGVFSQLAEKKMRRRKA